MDASGILHVVVACWIFAGGVIAYTIASRVGEDRGLQLSVVACIHTMRGTHIDSNDVCHGEEGCEAGTNLSGELGVLNFLLLDACQWRLSVVRTVSHIHVHSLRDEISARRWTRLFGH